jgi:protein arginine kinase activator
MKCELCHKAEAVLHVKHVVDGVMQELFLCKACAAETKSAEGQSLVDMILGGFDAGTESSASKRSAVRRCSGCGMSFVDYEKNNRLGCAECYDCFANELEPILDDMHRASRHIGKSPSRETTRVEIEKLRQELLKAVNCQDFEQAAELRDHIRELETA